MRTLALATAALASYAVAAAAPPVEDDLVTSATAEARARGPAALDELLAEYDAMRPGLVRDAIGRAVDEVAGQRYATVSRLYWYTDLAAAEAEAARRHVPILSLRMLGRLDEDLSCANSRFFRATLYANADLGRFLRDHFVLHWSSERPVPRVTIDFGDGRTIERTLTGNSAHYVLDERGHVLDVLPGLYAPAAFRRELTADLAVADALRGKDDATVAAGVVAHADAVVSAANAFGQTYVLPGPRGFGAPPVVTAQLASVSKGIVERPALRAVQGIAFLDDKETLDEWAVLGAQLYDLPDADVLDDQSRALVARLHDAGPRELASPPAQRALVASRLSHAILADTAQNQLQLRPTIARELVATHGRARFDALNAWIYATVFATPKSDPWLGLLTRTDFTGLPGDGVRMR